MLPDGIYKGEVVHKRYQPKKHAFNYPLAMILVDVEKIEATCRQSRWWSLGKFNLISLYRNDYIKPLGQEKNDVSISVFDTVKQRIKNSHCEDFSGTVKLLTNPRFFGFVFNPVSFYLCYNEAGRLTYILSEIHNTPWNERHTYTHKVPCDAPESMVFEFDKCFHVSPFMPMDLHYVWKFLFKNERVDIHMALMKKGEKQFHAGMRATHTPMTAANMLKLPLEFPFQTMRIVFRIYWHALRLWLKKVPFYTHPNTQSKTNNTK